MKNGKKTGKGKVAMAAGSEDPLEKGDGGRWRGRCRSPISGAGTLGWNCCCCLFLALLGGRGAFAQSPSEKLLSDDLAPRAFPPAERVQTGPSGRLVRETASRTGSEQEMPYHLHLLWESRYVSEGRDNLSGGGMASVASEMEFGWLTFNPWYAQGYDSDYDELNLNLILGFKPNDNIELYAGYTHLQFYKDHLYDNEIGAGIVLSYLKWANFFATDTYSFDAGGSFIETGLSREFALSDQVTLKGIGLVGINSGYIADGHDGANNLQLLVEASYKVSRRLELTMFAAYSWAIGKDAGRFVDDETLGDFFWGGAGVVVHF